MDRSLKNVKTSTNNSRKQGQGKSHYSQAPHTDNHSHAPLGLLEFYLRLRKFIWRVGGKRCVIVIVRLSIIYCGCVLDRKKDMRSEKG